MRFQGNDCVLVQITKIVIVSAEFYLLAGKQGKYITEITPLSRNFTPNSQQFSLFSDQSPSGQPFGFHFVSFCKSMAAKEAHKPAGSPARTPALTPEHQKRLFQSLFFMSNADLGVIQGLVEKLPSRWAHYPEFLAWAILARKLPVVEFLLRDGASLTETPNQLTEDLIGLKGEVAEALQNYRKQPFLTLAASHSSWEIVDFLISKGEDPLQPAFIGMSKTRLNAVISTPLGAAVFFNKPEIVRGLLTHGEIEFRTIEEKSLSRSKVALVKEYSGCTPLLLAVHRCESAEIVRELIEAGAEITAVDTLGNTALHLAVMLGKKEIVEVLLGRNCARLLGRNKGGETPASLAKVRGFHEIALLLGEGDSSDLAAASLLSALTAEEEKKKQKRINKKKPRKEPLESSKQPEDNEIARVSSRTAPLEETKQTEVAPARPVTPPSLLPALQAILGKVCAKPLEEVKRSQLEELRRLLEQGIARVSALGQVS